MKLKKLFAGVVAAAMIATMSFPAFAAESNLKDGKIELTKTFTAANRGTTSQEEDFTFTITAGATVNGKRVEVVNNKDLTGVPGFGTDKTLVKHVDNLTAGVTDKDSGTFTIDPEEELNITRPGIYYYTVTETDNGIQGVTYAKPLTMKVTAGYATADATELTYWVALTRDTAETNFMFNQDKKVGQDKAFENTYSAGDLVVTKAIRGSNGDRAHEFNFTITLKGQKGTKVSYTVDDKPTTGIIGEDGTLTIQNIKMADNGQFVISNIPYGVTYTISEATEGYTATAKKGSATANLTTSDTTAAYTDSVDAASTTIAFTNTLGNTVIDTGVILDNAPYILMLAVVAGGAMTLVIKKRREEE